MFATAKTISIFSIILSVINVLGVLMLTLMLTTYDFGFSIEFCLIIYLITSTLGTLLVTLGVRSICQDSVMNHESTSRKIREIENRCKILENQIK